MAVKIKGERIILRTPITSDAPEIYKQVRKADVRRMTLIPKPESVADSLRFIRFTQSSLRKKTDMILAIEEKANRRILGMIGIHNISLKSKNSELGYWLGKQHWGKGYASEAVKMMLSHAFLKLRMQRVYAYVISSNETSIRVLDKRGFSYEGCYRDHLFHSGKYCNLNLYSLLKEEFDAL